MHGEQVSAIILLANSGEPVANDLIEQLVLRQFWPSFAAEEEHRISQFVRERVGHLEGPATRGSDGSQRALDAWAPGATKAPFYLVASEAPAAPRRRSSALTPKSGRRVSPRARLSAMGSHRHSANAEQLADDLSVLRIADPARIVPADR